MLLVNLHVFVVFTGKHVEEEDDDDEEEEDCGGGDGETSEDGESGSEDRPVEEDAGSGNNAEDKDASNEKEIDTMLVDEKQETFDDLPGKGFHSLPSTGQ